MTLRRKAALVAVVSMFVAAGCGSSSDLVGAGAAVGSAANSGAGALSKDSFAGAVTQAQQRAQTAHVTATITAAGQPARLRGDIKLGARTSDYAAELTLSAPAFGGNIRLVVVHNVLYLNLGQPTGGKFARVRLGNANTPVGSMMSQLLGLVDPARSLRAMTAGMVSLTTVGTEQVDGVTTTHYRIEVDTRKVLAAHGLGELPGVSAAQLPATLRYDVWIGNDQLLRRVTFALGPMLSMVIDLSAWGQPVTISAPPPGQTVKGDPFAGMLGMMSKG